MAKKKKTTRIPSVPVDLWTSYVMHCPNCEDAVLVREDVRKGDSCVCPSCGQVRLVVGSILAECRREDGKRELTGESLGPFI